MCFLPEVSKDSSSIKVIDFGLAELFEPDQKALFFFLKFHQPQNHPWAGFRDVRPVFSCLHFVFPAAFRCLWRCGVRDVDLSDMKQQRLQMVLEELCYTWHRRLRRIFEFLHISVFQWFSARFLSSN